MTLSTEPNRVPIVCDVVGSSLLVLWLIASVGAAWTQNSDLFQRLGSYGVATVIAYYAAVQLSSSHPVPPGYNSMLHLQRMHFVQLGDNLAQSNRNTSLLAAAIKLENDKQGKETSRTISELATRVLSDSKPLEGSGLSAEMQTLSQNALNEAEEAEAGLKRVRFNNELAQAFVGVVSTLQWGFGDLIVGVS